MIDPLKSNSMLSDEELRLSYEKLEGVIQEVQRISPRFAAVFFHANALLCASGLKVFADLGMRTQVMVGNRDEPFLEEVQVVNSLLSRLAPELSFRSSGKVCERKFDQSPFLCLNLVSCRGAERVSRESSLLPLPPFHLAMGLHGLEKWEDAVLSHVEAAQFHGVLPNGKDALEICTTGIMLGYPGIAIRDFLDWYSSGRRAKLEYVRLDIPVKGAWPIYTFSPEHTEELEILENIRLLQRILKLAYASKLFQELRPKIENFLVRLCLNRPQPEVGFCIRESGFEPHPRSQQETITNVVVF